MAFQSRIVIFKFPEFALLNQIKLYPIFTLVNIVQEDNKLNGMVCDTYKIFFTFQEAAIIFRANCLNITIT